MANNAVRVQDLPAAANVAMNDMLVVLRQPNTSPSVRITYVNTFISSIVTGPYNSDSAANAGGVPIGQGSGSRSGVLVVPG